MFAVILCFRTGWITPRAVGYGTVEFLVLLAYMLLLFFMSSKVEPTKKKIIALLLLASFLTIEALQLSILAVFSGLGADIILTFAIGFLIAMIAHAFKLPNAVTWSTHPAYLFAIALISTACCGFGGYIAAHTAMISRVENAIAVGVLSVLAGLALEHSTRKRPVWFHILTYSSAIPAAWLGGVIVVNTP